MSFAEIAKGKEDTIITNLLSIFGVIEDQQLREMFDFMPPRNYLRIINGLRHDGLVSWSKDGHFIFSSKCALDRIDVENRVLCFSAFKYIRNNVCEFCIGPPPTVIIVSNASTTIDLIPVSGAKIDAINAQADSMPQDAERFLVGQDRAEYAGIIPRFKKDFAAIVTPEGKLNLYEL